MGYAETTIPPAAPQNVVAVQNLPFQIDVSWDPVTEDTSSPPRTISVGTYHVYVAEWSSQSDPESIPDSSYFFMGESSTNAFTHFISFISPGMSVYFKVTASTPARTRAPSRWATSIPAISPERCS